MKQITLLLLAITIISCTEKDKQFCECLDVSEQLTQASRAALIANPTEEDIIKIDSLKKIKKDQCLDYEILDGETLLKKRNDCGWKE